MSFKKVRRRGIRRFNEGAFNKHLDSIGISNYDEVIDMGKFGGIEYYQNSLGIYPLGYEHYAAITSWRRGTFRAVVSGNVKQLPDEISAMKYVSKMLKKLRLV